MVYISNIIERKEKKSLFENLVYKDIFFYDSMIDFGLLL